MPGGKARGAFIPDPFLGTVGRGWVVVSRVPMVARVAIFSENPNGIQAQSPGLDRTAGLPRGLVSSEFHQPQAGCGVRLAILSLPIRNRLHGHLPCQRFQWDTVVLAKS